MKNNMPPGFRCTRDQWLQVSWAQRSAMVFTKAPVILEQAAGFHSFSLGLQLCVSVVCALVLDLQVWQIFCCLPSQLSVFWRGGRTTCTLNWLNNQLVAISLCAHCKAFRSLNRIRSLHTRKLSKPRTGGVLTR